MLLESAPDAIVLVDSDGKIVLANRRTQELFGYQPGEIVGEEVELLVPPRFRAVHVSHRTAYAADPRTREMGAGLELYGQRKDGSQFPVEISLSPMAVGAQELVVTIIRDCSDRRAAERERLELAGAQAAHAEAEAGRARLASILGEIDAIVWESDARRRRFSFVSRRAENVLGYPLPRWLEEDEFWRGIVLAEDLQPAEDYFHDAIDREADQDYEYRVHDAEGRVVWIRDRVRVVVGDAGDEPRLRGVSVDVTARREMEERLLQAEKMDAVGQLAGGVAHDFNNLLVVISGYTDMLLGRIADEESLAQLREISDAARRAGVLTSQLLAFGRRAPNLVELVDLNSLIRGIEGMLRGLIDGDIQLRARLTEGVGPVRADPGQLEQVLVNLVINARDSMPVGGEISIRTEDAHIDGAQAAELGLTPGRYVVLSVTDNGSGMTSETKARIFEPFFTTKERGRGTGLGLATVYGVVEQAEGTITVDTEVGRGTAISIHLPRASAPEDFAEDPDAPRTAATILVVEDEAAVRRLVRSVLEDEGYRVQEAANGRDAIEHMDRSGKGIDLVLTDVVMPDTTGPELVARLGELGHDPRVLFMSGYADSHLLSRGLNGQAIRFLSKPFTSEQLSSRVSDAMSQRQPPEPGRG